MASDNGKLFPAGSPEDTKEKDVQKQQAEKSGASLPEPPSEVPGSNGKE